MTGPQADLVSQFLRVTGEGGEIMPRFKVFPDVVGADDDRAAVEERRTSYLAYAKIPQKYLDALASLRETPALTEVRRWVAEPVNVATTLILAGNYGTGKTIAAAWALGEVCGRFVRASSVARRTSEEGDIVDRLSGGSLLVIDDLGTEYADRHGWLISVIDAVIEARCADLRRTLITTNMSATDFRERYGGRVLDRVRGSGRWYQLAGESMRGRETT